MLVLNGATGPATYALAEVLTGCSLGTFSDYEATFDPASESESVLSRILAHLDHLHHSDRPLQYLLEVSVGPSRNNILFPAVHNAGLDWRRIKGWKLIAGE